jgi:hypothetical protein
MEYTYSVTTLYDGELVNTLRVSAKEYATYNLSDPTGKMYTKTFYRNGEVSIR